LAQDILWLVIGRLIKSSLLEVMGPSGPCDVCVFGMR